MSAGAIAAASATTNAIAAAGGLVRLAPEDFLSVLARTENPLVVHANHWTLFSSGMHQYLTSYRGIHFVTMATEELQLPKGTELIRAKTMYLPV